MSGAPGGRLRVVAAVSVVLATVAAVTGCSQPTGDVGRDANVTVSSRSAGSGHSLVDTGSVDRPGSTWTADGQGAGAWVEMTWVRPLSVSRLSLAQAGPADERVADGYVSFGDGSVLRVQLDPTAAATTVAFPARRVSSLRFTVGDLAPGGRSAGLGEVVVGTGTDAGVGVVDDAWNGNVARGATASASSSASAQGPERLVDGSVAETAAWRPSTADASPWVQLGWAEPYEVASVQLYGAGTGGGVGHGRLEFSDGSSVDVPQVLADPRRPTTVAFLPRVASSVRLVVDDTSGPVGLSELRAYAAGSTPARPPDDGARGTDARFVGGATCAPDADLTTTDGVVTVRCPQTGASVRGTGQVHVRAPGLTAVRATLLGPDSATPVSETTATVGSDGSATVTVDWSAAPRGPVTLELQGTAGPAATATSPVTRLQVYDLSAPAASPAGPPASDLAAGRTLVYDEEFDRPVSLSRDGQGADYATAKPNRTGAEDFGDAIFADPALGLDNVGVVDRRYLRIQVQPSPSGLRDPSSWGRTRTGGLLASARSGGSGFSAQYGYFEARMLSPAAAGTWPAFWTLPSPSLASDQPQVAELDAVELYGHDPVTGCQSTHVHVDGRDDANTQCRRLFDDARSAVGWHVYGMDVTPTGVAFSVDGRLVETAPQVPGGDQPMFFMVDLALGGGWPVELGAVGNRASLYVDYVRVYT